MIFGAGWAITAACPGTAATNLGSGSLLGVVPVAGIIAGIALRDLAVRPPRPGGPPRRRPSDQTYHRTRCRVVGAPG